MFAFICNKCGYGISISRSATGIPNHCPICNGYLTFKTASQREYHQCETNDGKIKEPDSECDHEWYPQTIEGIKCEWCWYCGKRRKIE